MRQIRKRRTEFILLLGLGLGLTLLFCIVNYWLAMIVCLATDLVCFALLLRQSHLLKVAGLICDNSIVTVPAALVSTSTSQMKQDVDETMYVDLLHGLTKREEILAVTSKLLFETGVEADVSGW